MKKRRTPTEEERLEEFFGKLMYMIPHPPKGWEKKARPCKWDKIIKERNNNPDGTG
jgi:hypothetical protein